jgi:hypothetical protein
VFRNAARNEFRKRRGALARAHQRRAEAGSRYRRTVATGGELCLRSRRMSSQAVALGKLGPPAGRKSPPPRVKISPRCFRRGPLRI